MSSVHPKKLLRSSAFRLALLYMVLVGVSALLLLSFIYYSTASYMLRQADETIEAEIRGLAERYRLTGLAGLNALIQERLGRQPSGSCEEGQPTQLRPHHCRNTGGRLHPLRNT